MTKQVFALAGPLGCGKSTAAEMIANIIRTDGKFVQIAEMSDYVRSEYNAHVDTDTVDDNGLGAWAAEQKEADGAGSFAHDLAVLYEADNAELIVSGIRCPEEVTALEDVYGEANVTTIAIWTLPEVRFERKHGSQMTPTHPEFETFAERDERELDEWGCADIYLDDDTEFVIANNQDKIDLQRQLLIAVDSVYGTILESPIESPFVDMDDDVVRSFL